MLIAIALSLTIPVLFVQAVPSSLTIEQKEEFLRTADLKKIHGAKKGVTGTVRATLATEGLSHDASVQRIDEEKLKYETARGTEYNFRDCYKFNIAAYRLGRMLGLDGMIPPSVERGLDGHKGAWTWWIEDVQMDEVERLRKQLQAPDKDLWSRQYLVMKVFDQLIYNTDRNQTNILYDKDWRLWMIDHTRAFRLGHKLLDEKALERCDRVLLEKLTQLNESRMRSELEPFLRPEEIRAVLARRDLIVKHFQNAPDRLYDYLPAEQPVAPKLAPSSATLTVSAILYEQ